MTAQHLRCTDNKPTAASCVWGTNEPPLQSVLGQGNTLSLLLFNPARAVRAQKEIKIARGKGGSELLRVDNVTLYLKDPKASMENLRG